MAQRGYTNVYAFTGGIPEWRSFQYPMYVNEKYTEIHVTKLSPAEIQKILAKNNPFIIDVRPLNFHLNQSYLAGAVHVPLIEFMKHKDEFPRNRPILVTDWAMKQAPVAAIYLTLQNFNVLGVLKGGMERWIQEKLPVENIPHPQ